MTAPAGTSSPGEASKALAARGVAKPSAWDQAVVSRAAARCAVPKAMAAVADLSPDRKAQPLDSRA